MCCISMLPGCIKLRGIGATTLKPSLYILPGQDYCDKVIAVGKLTECKLNDLCSVLIP
jgi:hypothetical protein